MVLLYPERASNALLCRRSLRPVFPCSSPRLALRRPRHGGGYSVMVLLVATLVAMASVTVDGAERPLGATVVCIGDDACGPSHRRFGLDLVNTGDASSGAMFYTRLRGR